MKKVLTSTSVLSAGAIVLVTVLAQPAWAGSWTFGFNGAGISGLATITAEPNVSPPDPDTTCGPGGNPCRSDPPGAYRITDISGLFSDANIGISNAHIQALVPISPTNERDPTFDPLVPTSLSYIDYTNEAPPASGALSYDNLFYPGAGGNPFVCNPADFPFKGTFLDVFGVAFTITGGGITGTDTVDFWGDGNLGFGPLTFGAAVTDGPDANGVRVNELDYQFSGINAAISEPSTWAMLLVGFAGVGFAGYRRSQKGSVAIVAG